MPISRIENGTIRFSFALQGLPAVFLIHLLLRTSAGVLSVRLALPTWFRRMQQLRHDGSRSFSDSAPEGRGTDARNAR